MEKIIFDAEDMSARKERNNLKIGLTKSRRGGGLHTCSKKELRGFLKCCRRGATQKAVLVLFAHFWIGETKSSKETGH